MLRDSFDLGVSDASRLYGVKTALSLSDVGDGLSEQWQAVKRDLTGDREPPPTPLWRRALPLAALGAAGAGLYGLSRRFNAGKLMNVHTMPQPNYATLDALAEETANLAAQNRRRKFLGRLYDTPNVHAQDLALGGALGGALGYGAGSALDQSEEGNRLLPRLALAGAGAVGGAMGANALGNVARRYLANTSPLQGYATKSMPKFTWDSLVEHGIKDKPGPDAAGLGGLHNPRWELFRRYLNIHTPDRAKDFFVRNVDGSLSFNPATTGEGSLFHEHYVKPYLNETPLQTTFERTDKTAALPSPAPLLTLAHDLPAAASLSKLLTSAGRPLEEAATVAPRLLDSSGALLSTEPAAAAVSKLLTSAGQPIEEAASAGSKLLTSAGQPIEEAASVAPRLLDSQGLPINLEPPPPSLFADAAAPAKQVKVPEYEPVMEPLKSPPRYSTRSDDNPFSKLFGSHDMRHVPDTAVRTPSGGAETTHEIGDTWNFALDPHETPEIKMYLKGLMETSPSRWMEFLNQPSAGHEHAFSGRFQTAAPPVKERLSQYGMRQLLESGLRHHSPVVQQRVKFTYDRPSGFVHSEPSVPVSPAKVEALPNPSGEATLNPLDVSKLRKGLAVGAGALGAGGLYGALHAPEEDGDGDGTLSALRRRVLG